MELGKYSMGIGDRFGHEAEAQLSGLLASRSQGIEVIPVWNKSNREHTIIGTSPSSVRVAADAAVSALGYEGAYYVDADHISLKTVDWFLPASDFFTLDVADFTGQSADPDSLESFLGRHHDLIGRPLAIPGLSAPLVISSAEARSIAGKFLLAVQEAGKIYRHIEATKGRDGFVAEVSMDETDLAQGPQDMLFILAALADEGLPAQTLAPKFSGRFNKGVDYVGDLDRFEREFNDDLAVMAFAVKEFGLPHNLKLSIHSGSDKFSIYPIMKRAIRRFDAGLHLKTAGTTWLEELIGLAAAGGEGLALAKEIYRVAYGRFDELKKPYSTVIDIDWTQLPTPDVVDGWSSRRYADSLRHDQRCPDYNMHFRQMLHVAFKVAAELGDRYTSALEEYGEVIAENVRENIFERHLRRVFLD